MIRRISKQSDLVIELEMDLSNIASLEIVYYTDSEYSYSINLEDVDITDQGQFIYLPSQELELMNEGQLKSIVKYNFTNTNYPDNMYNNVINQNLEVWLQQ